MIDAALISGEVLDAALAEPVTLMKRGKPKLVMLSVEEFERLTYPRANAVEDAPDRVREELLTGLKALIETE